MTIGEEIKRRRVELGMSADEVAAAIGKDRSTIYRYEKGDIESAPMDVIVSLAQALKTTPPILLGWDKRPAYWVNPEYYDVLSAQAEQLFQTTDLFAWTDVEVDMFFDMAKLLVKIRDTEEYDGHITFLRTLFRHMNS